MWYSFLIIMRAFLFLGDQLIPKSCCNPDGDVTMCSKVSSFDGPPNTNPPYSRPYRKNPHMYHTVCSVLKKNWFFFLIIIPTCYHEKKRNMTTAIFVVTPNQYSPTMHHMALLMLKTLYNLCPGLLWRDRTLYPRTRPDDWRNCYSRHCCHGNYFHL